VITPDDPRRTALASLVERCVLSTPVTDVHTHLYDPAFGSLLLWGIDDQLVYHYLVAEAFRHLQPSVRQPSGSLDKAAQAERVWEALFVQHSLPCPSPAGVS
jgi:hypothetical protein